MTWLDLVRIERRLLWRSRLMGLYPVMAFGIATVTLGAHNEGMALAVPALATALLIVQLPILVVILAPSVTGTWGRKGDCLWSTASGLPVIATARLAAASASVSVLLLLVIVFTGIVVAVFIRIDAGGHSSEVFHSGMQLAVDLGRLLFPVTWAQIALVQALAHFLRRTVWVAVLCLVPTLFISLGGLIYTQSFLHPFNYSWVALSFDAVQGLGADGPFQARAALLMVVAALGLWGVAILLAPRQDERVGWQPGQAPWVYGAAALGLGLCLASAWVFQMAAQRSIVPRTETAQINAWEVVSAEHRVQWDRDVLTVASRLTLRSPASSQPALHAVDLALNTGLSVQAAWLNGQSVPVHRRGEVVALRAPDAALSLPAEVEVEISYAGTPVLLREDYGDVLAIPYFPPRFRHRAVGYMGPDTLYWVRDSDWLVWPLSPYAHIAQDSNHIELSMAPAAARVSRFSTAGSVGPDPAAAAHQLHVWTEQVPAFLIAAGPYRREGAGAGTLYLGRFQATEKTEIARQFLAWSAALHRFSGNPPAAMTLAVIPYGDRMLFADSYVLVPYERLQWPFPVGLEDPSQQQQYLAGAIRLSADWLSEKIDWEQAPMIFKGVPRGINEDTWEFPNPQAPFRRWIPNPAPRVWPQAFAIVLAHQVFFAEDPELIRAERAAWEYQRDIAGAIWRPGHFVRENEPMLFPYVAPVGNEKEMDYCALAYAVSALHGVADTYGPDFLWDWLEALEIESAQGRVRISEAVIWQTGSELADGLTPPPRNAACKAETVTR